MHSEIYQSISAFLGRAEQKEQKFIALVKKIMKTMNFKANNNSNKILFFIKTFVQWEGAGGDRGVLNIRGWQK